MTRLLAEAASGPGRDGQPPPAHKASTSSVVDLAAGLALGALSLVFLIGALRMPTQTLHWTWLNAPGLVPAVLAAALLAQALFLAARGARRLGIRRQGTAWHTAAVRWGAGRVALTLASALAFALLLGRMPFAVLTAIFVFSMTLAFKGASVWKAAVSALITAIAVTWIFTRLFLVPLP